MFTISFWPYDTKLIINEIGRVAPKFFITMSMTPKR